MSIPMATQGLARVGAMGRGRPRLREKKTDAVSALSAGTLRSHEGKQIYWIHEILQKAA